ncbi:3-methylmercaptopropionyl-CoA dehydrogenase [Alphaproteobacteria bacterium SO-S41]|nr:3-methylmercaptopropionyl-CoA dehydrogenase [Alphaproteobacteria bacterium SO-S41]
MAGYQAPLQAIRFTLDSVVDADRLAASGAHPDFDRDLRDSVLEEAAKLAVDVLAPLNRTGDAQGARLENGVVRTTPGFPGAYRAFAEGGWAGIAADPAFGGQGLPHTLAVAVEELWQSANMAFGLCPLLTHGAIEALSAHGTDELKSVYLPKLIAGTWTGTMNLTEPAAGSDVGALKARAVRTEDGSYRITGQKIFITWGEHDCAENIVHLVLARLAGAPPGTRGISLFLVPKFLPDADGKPGVRNDLACVGVEHKLGIHGSPTCTMSFGDHGGATGFLIGQENRGMAAMFTMMNSARLNVGVQGVAIAERALQHARAYAADRKQGKPVGLQHEGTDMVPIDRHPDVRRMLLSMQAGVEAARAICLATAVAADLARHHPDPAERVLAKAREELLTPIAKAWSTDMGVKAASSGVQIHGGMGFIEETGAAQFYRDARILPIYEGTNGIQAIDLVMRKIGLSSGAVVEALFHEIAGTTNALVESADAGLAAMGTSLSAGLETARRATAWLQERLAAGKPYDALAGATPFLELMGVVVGGHFLARGAIQAVRGLAAGEGDTGFLSARLAAARFFAETEVPHAVGLLGGVRAGAETLYATDFG